VTSIDRGGKYLSGDITKFTEKIKHNHQQKTEDVGEFVSEERRKRRTKSRSDKIEGGIIG
jgi:hypothetical protein